MGGKESRDQVGKGSKEGGEKEGLAPSPASGVQQAHRDYSWRTWGWKGGWTNPLGIQRNMLDRATHSAERQKGKEI